MQRFLACGDVEAIESLVEDQDFGIMNKRAGEEKLACLPVRHRTERTRGQRG